MTERYFEALPRRNSAAYAEAYSYFYADMAYVGGAGLSRRLCAELSHERTGGRSAWTSGTPLWPKPKPCWSSPDGES